jgi:hypothetical protein
MKSDIWTTFGEQPCYLLPMICSLMPSRAEAAQADEFEAARAKFELGKSVNSRSWNGTLSCGLEAAS